MAKEKSKPKDALETQFGRVISFGNELLNKKKNLASISVSPSLDLALNGGLLEGSWTVISGDPKTGKSTTSMHICRKAQDLGRPAIYVDVETRLKKYNLEGIKGLDLEKIKIVHAPDEGEPLSGEDFLTIVENLISRPENAGAVCVIDSVSSLVPRGELDQGPSGSIRASLPKLMSHWIKKNAQTVTKNRIVMILITHYITNTSGYGKLKNPDGGLMIQYQMDTRLDVQKNEPWEEGEKKIGQKVSWKVSCSSNGSSGVDCNSYIRYGTGIDEKKEIIEMAESFGVIEKSGAWYNIPCIENNPKFQGQANLYQYVVSDESAYNLIYAKVNEMMND